MCLHIFLITYSLFALIHSECTKFCEDWGKLLHGANPENAGQIRQMIEAGKVRVSTMYQLFQQDQCNQD